MKLTTVLEQVTKAFSGLRLSGLRDARLGALDRGILEVALLVAALDGTVLPAEYAAFETLAQKCRAGSAKNTRACLDRALRSAGYLMAMAQVGVYTQEERIAAFVDAAADALPSGFDEGTPADVRRAFALWVAMGVSDGSFSDIERAAVEALVRYFSKVRQFKADAAVATQSYAAYRPIMTDVGSRPMRAVAFLEDGFLARAERIVRDLAVPSKREAAEAAFEKLIGA